VLGTCSQVEVMLLQRAAVRYTPQMDDACTANIKMLLSVIDTWKHELAWRLAELGWSATGRQRAFLSPAALVVRHGPQP
jgi:hypothetical protein